MYTYIYIHMYVYISLSLSMYIYISLDLGRCEKTARRHRKPQNWGSSRAITSHPPVLNPEPEFRIPKSETRIQLSTILL